MDFFNLCPVNLLLTSCGPLETFVAHSGRQKSTLDHILLPNCLFDSTVFCKKFDKSVDNTSGHLPIMLKIKYYFNSFIMMIIMMPLRIMLLNLKSCGQVFLNKKLIKIVPGDLTNYQYMGSLLDNMFCMEFSFTSTPTELKHFVKFASLVF